MKSNMSKDIKVPSAEEFIKKENLLRYFKNENPLIIDMLVTFAEIHANELLDELQLKLISMSVGSQEFDSDEVHEAVSVKLHTLMNWVKIKRLIIDACPGDDQNELN